MDDPSYKKGGPVLVIAPANLLIVWKSEFDKMVDPSLPMSLTIRHANLKSTVTNEENISLEIRLLNINLGKLSSLRRSLIEHKF